MPKKRILVHDTSGHHFPISLARELSQRGHEVLHIHNASFLSPRGNLRVLETDAPTFNAIPISLSKPVKKNNFIARALSDIEYGRLTAKAVEEFKPDFTLCANTALDALDQIQLATHRCGGKFLFWVQDLQGIAINRIVGEKLPIVGKLIGKHYIQKERKLLAKSEFIVLICKEFETEVPPNCKEVHVIENWAPLEGVSVRSKDNDWSREKGISKTFNYVYSGTLGMKHNPDYLVQLAKRFSDRPEVRVVVCSEGESTTFMAARIEELNLKNMFLFPFQPVEQFSEVLGSADVVVGILDDSAGEFSVPSKVLNYFCSGRAVLLSMPPRNLIARTTANIEAGLVSEPSSLDDFLENAEVLYADANKRVRFGINARDYAERTFDIVKIADRFEAILGT